MLLRVVPARLNTLNLARELLNSYGRRRADASAKLAARFGGAAVGLSFGAPDSARTAISCDGTGACMPAKKGDPEGEKQPRDDGRRIILTDPTADRYHIGEDRRRTSTALPV
jgi:hypothetical protein